MSATQAQIDATNKAIDDLGTLDRFSLEGKIAHLLEVLREDELPTKALAVDYRSNDDNSLLITTNQRFMFLTDKFFSFGKVAVRDYPLDKISAVHFKLGIIKHRITIQMGPKKEEFHGHGQVRSQKMAIHLRRAIASEHDPKSLVVENVMLSQTNELGDTIVNPNKAEVKLLPEVLEKDEVPEQFLEGRYDSGHGLNVSNLKYSGLMVTTDRRLVFINKQALQKARIYSFPYETITRIESTKGLLSGNMTVHTEQWSELFDNINSLYIEHFVEHLRSKVA